MNIIYTAQILGPLVNPDRDVTWWESMFSAVSLWLQQFTADIRFNLRLITTLFRSANIFIGLNDLLPSLLYTSFFVCAAICILKLILGRQH